MLMISKKQMEALRQAVRAEFNQHTLAVLREAVPDFHAGLDQTSALRRLEDSVAKAISYGLSTERKIRDFIAVQTVAGEDFDLNPSFADTCKSLTDVTLSPGERLASARQRVADVLARKERGMSDSLFPDLGGEDRPADSTVMPCPEASKYLNTVVTFGGGSSFLAQQQGDSGGSSQETWEKMGNILSGNGWRTNAEVEREKYRKLREEQRKAVAGLRAYGFTEDQLSQLTYQQQIDLYNAIQRGETSVTSGGTTINIVPGGGATKLGVTTRSPTRDAAFREAKLANDIPLSKQPDKVYNPNTPEGRQIKLDSRRNVRLYEFTKVKGRRSGFEKIRQLLMARWVAVAIKGRTSIQVLLLPKIKKLLLIITIGRKKCL
jgi:hypothetical protein